MKLTMTAIFTCFLGFSAMASASVKFIEAKSFTQAEGLPPLLNLTFDIACNQTFLSIVRHDTPTPLTGHVMIAVGGLVEEVESNCTEAAVEKVVNAGVTFSGVENEVVLIQK